MSITVVVFDRKNYDMWEKAVMTALRAKNKLEFIKGILTQPDRTQGGDARELQAWEIVNSVVSSWLLNIIDPKLRLSIAQSDSARGMGSALKQE